MASATRDFPLRASGFPGQKQSQSKVETAPPNQAPLLRPGRQVSLLRMPAPFPAMTRLPLPPAVLVLVLLAALPELVLLGADWGLWGSARWRPLAYQNGAFWAGLLHGWTPNYAAQPVTMFLSYAWLHAGPGHLAGNLLALAWLGPGVVARRGTLGLILLWIAATLGGAAAFGLLATTPAPMVGASGALFGLAAAWTVTEVQGCSGPRARVVRAVGIILLLIALNAATWVLQGGRLAWEAHLGGFLAGLVLVLARAR